MRPDAQEPLRARLALAMAIAALALPLGNARAQSPPAQAAAPTNPTADDPAAVGRGRELFLEHCAPCHGDGADGRGPAATGLTPPPADLAGPGVVPLRSDAYLFARLTAGKRGSAMPSFQQTLSERERWQIVSFLRSLAARSAGIEEPSVLSAPGS